MTISLSDYEAGHDFDGDYDEALSDLQKRLERIQVAHIVHDKRSVIMFEGWDASGKGGIIKRMTANLDPRYYQVWAVGGPSEEEGCCSFLWRLWGRLAAGRNIGSFAYR